MGLGLLLYILIPAFQIGIFVDGQPFAEVLDWVNFVGSILTYHWLLNGVILSAKLPALDRWLPYDQRIRWHILGVIGFFFAFLWHAVYKLLLGKQIDVVSWALLGVFVVMVALSVLWIPVPGLRRFRLRLMAGIRRGPLKSYDWLKQVHNLLFLGMAILVYLHVFLVALFLMVPWYSVVLYNLIFVAAVAAYGFAWIRKRLLPTFTVISVTESEGILTLRLKANPKLRYRAGQFAFLRFDRPDLKGEDHPFSFLTAPQDSEVAFGIRALGDFTKKLVGLKPGDQARVNGGFGGFRPGTELEPVFIASGIGVVPFIGILKELQAAGDSRSIQFHLAVNTEAEIPDRDRLADLEKQLPSLRVYRLLAGRGDPLYSVDYFRPFVGDLKRQRFYVCSSPAVRPIVTRALRQLGVRRSRIHYEDFSFG